MTSRVYKIRDTRNYFVPTLSGHRNYIVGAFFGKNDEYIYTISKDGALLVWHWITYKESERRVVREDRVTGEKVMTVGRWRMKEKYLFYQDHRDNSADVSSVMFNKKTCLLLVGFLNGLFGL
eukprot:CAMPEP_0174271336 /NCGR_PEP_ID=MMETSP0439-20130205/47573_1 /TAXON_ID=0 /ORGANISM="Stereomyxa ramosa, Strain Chinc5" /LENGTH=121 /DNA_ID=CAMNT_0015361279 /DNA_START=461 /DNA_END=822 /DNA_ORIENTATION=+